MENNKEKKVILDSSKETKKIDTSIIEKNEYFSYLGKLYVKKIPSKDKYDQDGNLLLKKIFNQDGSSMVVGNFTEPGEAEFYGVVITNTDDPDVLAKYGKPLTTQVSYYGPIDPISIFVLEGEPIRYKRRDFNEVLFVKDGKIDIEQKRTPVKGKRPKRKTDWDNLN